MIVLNAQIANMELIVIAIVVTVLKVNVILKEFVGKGILVRTKLLQEICVMKNVMKII